MKDIFGSEGGAFENKVDQNGQTNASHRKIRLG
jgi:hypothetical protein